MFPNAFASEVQGERRAETRSSYAEPQPSLAVASQMQWQRYDNSKGRCLTVTDLAKLFLKKLQKCGFLPTGGYHNTHTARCYLALGDTPRPHLSYFLWRKERSKETSTPSKASPYTGRMQLILDPARNQSFGMTHRACAPSG